MFDEPPAGEAAPLGAAPPNRLPWVLAAFLALSTVSALAVAGWLWLDRDRVRDELALERDRVAALQERASDAEAARSELEAQVEELIGLGEGAVEGRRACREAVAQAVEMWNDLVRALNAAAEPDPEEFERFAREAEERRDEVNVALGECESATA